MARYKVTVNGTPYEVHVETTASGAMQVKLGDKTATVHVQAVHVPAAPAKDAGVQPALPTSPSAKPPHRQDPNAPAVKAAICGTVVQIHVRLGAVVRRGQVLLTLEAMKMENPVLSPVSGRVKELYVKQADTVKRGDVMVVLEPSD